MNSCIVVLQAHENDIHGCQPCTYCVDSQYIRDTVTQMTHSMIQFILVMGGLQLPVTWRLTLEERMPLGFWARATQRPASASHTFGMNTKCLVSLCKTCKCPSADNFWPFLYLKQRVDFYSQDHGLFTSFPSTHKHCNRAHCYCNIFQHQQELCSNHKPSEAVSLSSSGWQLVAKEVFDGLRLCF